ncbi:MAG: hypothetical protein HDT02_04250 [Bacteroidales bacterium]|nr:hypothetical protein [Bacteroidales bacterium]
MSDEEKARRGDMLRNTPAIEIGVGQIVATKELSARKAAEQWWDENVSEPAFYDTEVGEVEINKNSVESSLAHKYGQMKLDAITSLIDGFENAVYLGTMPDFTRQEGVSNHFFAYPIMYDGKRCYVFCRAIQDANKNRLYVHEVFVEDRIKKGDTLQTAASQPHGGIALYRDILANVLETVAKTEPQQPNNAVSSDSSLPAGEQSGKSSAEPNGKSTVSEGKDNALLSDKQAEAKESSKDRSRKPLEKQLEVIRPLEEKLRKDPDSISNKEACVLADACLRFNKNVRRGSQPTKSEQYLVERALNNLAANGYTVVDYSGQKYNEGMRVNSEFVIDESLPAGTRIITYCPKVQVHKEGILIQKASIIVAQNLGLADNEGNPTGKTIGDMIKEAEAEVNTNPTDGQKEAGNYRKGHVNVEGFDVTIEQPKGSVRRGKDADGNPWESKMNHTYGYIRGTESVDGDHIDVFLSDTPEEGNVYVVDQYEPDGTFDEHKVMYGFPDAEAARSAYLSNYEKGWGNTRRIDVTGVTKEGFKKWIGASRRKTKPFADYKSVKAITEDVDQTRTNINKEGIVADGDGKPLTLYHGTPNKEVTSVTMLEPGHKRMGEEAPARFNGDGVSFTPEMSVAQDYATEAGYGKGRIFPANIRLQNPYYTLGVANFTPEEAAEFTAGLKAKGHDGIINYVSKAMREAGALPNEVIVFDNSAILSIEDNDLDGLDYTITPTEYHGKKKKTPVWVVKFDRDLSDEEKRALVAYVKEPLAEGKKTSRGWLDKESGQFYMRSEEAAKGLAGLLDNPEEVADAQPLTAEDYKETLSMPKSSPEPPKKPTPMNRVDVEGLFNDLGTKGETKLSDHSAPVKSESAPAKPESKRMIVDDEMRDMEDELRSLLGIDDSEGDRGDLFKDPEDFTNKERMQITSLGITYALKYFDQGIVSFPDFADRMVRRMGEKIRPWLKAFYGGARDIPGYDHLPFTPADEVKAFDVMNFDKAKKDTDPIMTAAEVVAEVKAEAVVREGQREIVEERNRKRKENDKQREADTEAIAGEAEAVAGEAEKHAGVAGGRKPERKTILRDLKRIDDTLDEVNDQLALLGYYEADLDSPEHEVYGFRRSAEKKAVRDAVKLAKQLVDDLGIEIDKVAGKTTEQMQKSRGKNDTAVRANIAPVGGDITVNLPYPDGRNLHINIGLSPTHERGIEPNRGGGAWEGDNYEVDRIMFRFGEDHNHFLSTDVTYGRMLDEIRRAAKWGQPKKQVTPKEDESHNGYKRGDEVLWDRYGNGKWEKVKIEDFDADGSPIFESVKGIMSEKGDWSRVKPADGVFGEAKRVATKAQEDRKKKERPVEKGWTLKPTSILSTNGSGAKVQFSVENAKLNLLKVSTDWKYVINSKGFIATLTRALGSPDGLHAQSFYYTLARGSDEILTLRLSNHNVNAAKHDGKTPEISIVIKSRRQPNRFYPSSGADVREYVYFKEDIAKGDGNTLSLIAKDLADLLDTGQYRDSSGLALVNVSPADRPTDALSPDGGFLTGDKPADAVDKAVEVRPGGKKKPAKKKQEVKPEQPVGVLFGGLFDEKPETPKENEKRNGNKPSQEVAGGERAHTVGDDETGIDGRVPTAGTEPTGKGGAADEKGAGVERGADGATHGTDAEYNQLGKKTDKKGDKADKTRYMDPGEEIRKNLTGDETSTELKAQKALELSERLGLPLNLNRTEEDLKTLPSGRHRRAWGFYSRTDELEGRPGVTINLPNLRTVRDVVKAVFHEGVWHKGIRLFCKTEQERDRLMDHLYDNSSEEIRGEIDALEAEMFEQAKDSLSRNERFLRDQAKPGERIYAGSPLAIALAHVEAAQRRERGEYRRDATEEFGARVQEEVEEQGYEKMRADKLSFWQRVVNFMEKAMSRILRGIKIKTPWKYTRKEYQAMGSLFESKLREQAPEGPLREAEKIVKRYDKERKAENERTGFNQERISC